MKNIIAKDYDHINSVQEMKRIILHLWEQFKDDQSLRSFNLSTPDADCDLFRIGDIRASELPGIMGFGKVLSLPPAKTPPRYIHYWEHSKVMFFIDSDWWLSSYEFPTSRKTRHIQFPLDPKRERFGGIRKLLCSPCGDVQILVGAENMRVGKRATYLFSALVYPNAWIHVPASPGSV